MAKPPKPPRAPRRIRKTKKVSLAEQQKRGWGRYEQAKAEEIVSYKRRQIKHIRKKALGYVTATAVSMRHEADLLEPSKPFAEKRTKGHGLQSTAIVSYEYYPEKNMLILVWWKDWRKGIIGSAYAYFGVPFDTYEGLLRASSKGRYVYYNIRTSFKYKKL